MNINNTFTLLLLVLLTATFAAPASADDTPPAPHADTTTVIILADADPCAPAAEPVSPQLNDLLDKLEARGSRLSSFAADMLVREEQILVEALTIQQGRLYYKTDDQTVRFRIHIHGRQQMDLEQTDPAPVVPLDLDYAYDGRWFIKRDARTKTLQRWERPLDKSSFRLGKGPVPLPFALRKQDVLREFHTELIPPDPNTDPTNTQHLFLTPRDDSSFAEEYVSLELWIDRDRLIPRQLRFEKHDFEISTVIWSDIKIDDPLADEHLAVPPPGPDWSVEETPYQPPTEDKP